MNEFEVHGIVKNGQVVLERPLDVPDGTCVTVVNSEPEDLDPHDPQSLRDAVLAFVKDPALRERLLSESTAESR